MDYPAVLRGIMTAGKLNQAKLAKRLKVTQPTVSRWLSKAVRPDHDQHERIVAEATRIGVLQGAQPFEAEAPDERPTVATVKVVGWVGAGSQAQYFPTEADLDEVPAPEDTTAETVAVEIRGKSLGELFDRWLVFYDDVRRPVTSDLIGRLCVIGLADERVLIKKIRRGHGGLFDLHSNTEEPIRDVAIEWAARVKQMVPR